VSILQTENSKCHSQKQKNFHLPKEHVLIVDPTVVDLVGRALLAVVVAWVVHLL
jgi:hypothetical protein